MNNVGLTVKSLAIIGILDDFYNLYFSIKKIYEVQREKYINENGKGYPLLSKTWDELCAKSVRKEFEPYLQKYLYLYTSGYEEIFANTYAFQDFSFIDKAKTTAKFAKESPFILGFKSFSDFLIEFQMVITCLDYRKNYINNPKHTIQQSWTNINDRINSNVKKHIEEYVNSENIEFGDVRNVLYIFDRLSNVYCYKEGHEIIPTRFVATVVKTAKKITIPVHYCTVCKKYFIGAKTLAVFEKTFGKLILERKSIDEMNSKFIGFGAESKLHQLGYNVIEGNLSEEERKELLIYLLENDFITYVELCATIEQNISLFQHSVRHKLAVEKWKVDLKAIGKYILKNPVLKE